MVNTAQSLDLATIERLAGKVTALVQLLERTRSELTETTEDNSRLTNELAALQERFQAARREDDDVQALLDEREQVRSRVAEMLEMLQRRKHFERFERF